MAEDDYQPREHDFLIEPMLAPMEPGQAGQPVEVDDVAPAEPARPAGLLARVLALLGLRRRSA